MNSHAGKLRRGGLAGLVAAGLVFATSGAQASGVPVVDAVHLGISKLAWVEQFAQMTNELKKQVEQYETQVKQYQQMKLDATEFKSDTGYREDIAASFPERDVNDGVQAQCGTSPAGTVNQGARVQQYTICVRIVQTQNRRYNMVRNVFEGIREKDEVIQDLNAERNSLGEDEIGKQQSIDSKIALLEAQIQMDLQAHNTTLEAYNNFLQGLREENHRIAASVLNGSRGPGGVIGEIAAHGTLKLALQAARLRER